MQMTMLWKSNCSQFWWPCHVAILVVAVLVCGRFGRNSDKLMVMGNSKNLWVFNFANLLISRKSGAREITFYSRWYTDNHCSICQHTYLLTECVVCQPVYRKSTNFGAFAQETVDNISMTAADGAVQRSHATDVLMFYTGTTIHQTLDLNISHISHMLFYHSLIHQRDNHTNGRHDPDLWHFTYKFQVGLSAASWE